MEDKDISITTVSAAVMWIIAVGLVLVDLFKQTGTGDLGIVMSAGAATVTVRGFFCHQFDRERNAFEVGRDYEAAKVRSIRQS